MKHVLLVNAPLTMLLLSETSRGRVHKLSLAQQLANQALPHRRLRIEQVHSSVQRCRLVKDRLRLWTAGIRDLVMELCCALHNVRVRLTPWQPMVESGYTQSTQGQARLTIC